MRGKYFEEMTVGEKFPCNSRTVTEADIILFTGIVGLRSPIFLDETFAKKTAYGGRIAPGALVFSIATGLFEPYLEGTGIALLGIQDLRFSNPVRPGDTISVEVEVIEKKETSKFDRGILIFNYVVRNQKAVTVASFKHIAMVIRQP